MRRITIGITAFLMLLMINYSSVYAQSEISSALINYVDTQENSENLSLQIYFTPLNSSGVAVRATDISDAIVTVNGTATTGVLTRNISAPLYMVLVLDMSGSMQEQVNAMRSAAQTAVSKAPPNAQIAIITFNTLSKASGFLSKQEAAREINAISATDAANGTCLYDTAVEAITQVQRATAGESLARRAVILFTDGKDRKRQDQPAPCSNTTNQEVVNRANSPETPVPVYAIGLGDFDENLFDIANKTGGIGVVGRSGLLTGAFEEIIDSLAAQWLVTADISVEAGQHIGELKISVPNADPITQSFTLASNQTYDTSVATQLVQTNGTPTILTADPIQDRANERWLFDIFTENDDSVGEWEIAVIASKEGNKIIDLAFSGSEINNLTLPADALEFGIEYEARFSAKDPSGNYFKNDNGEIILRTIEFQHWSAEDAILPELIIDSIEVDRKEGLLLARLRGNNLPETLNLSWQLISDDNITTQVTLEEIEPNMYGLSLNELDTGSYLLRTQLLDDNDQLVSGAESEKFQWTSNKPGLIARLIDGLRDNWYLLFFLLALILAALAFFMWRSRQESKRIGTPFAQKKGIFGKKSKQQPRDELSKSVLYRPEIAQKETSQYSLDDAWGNAPYETNTLAVGMAAIIVKKSPAPVGKNFPIPILRERFIFGRKEGDLILDEPHVSREHAVILQVDDNYYLKDLNSSNYTFLNGVKLKPHVENPIRTGDIIALGRQTIVLFEVR